MCYICKDCQPPKGVDAERVRIILVKKVTYRMQEFLGSKAMRIKSLLERRNKGIKHTTNSGIKLLLERQYDLICEAVKNTYVEVDFNAFEHRTKKYVEPLPFSYSLI